MNTESHHIIEKSRQFVEQQKLRDVESARVKYEQEQSQTEALRDQLRHDNRWQAIQQDANNPRLENNIRHIVRMWERISDTAIESITLDQEMSQFSDLDGIHLNPSDSVEDVLNRGITFKLIPDIDLEGKSVRFLIKICHDSHGHRIVVFGSYGQPVISTSIDELNKLIESGIAKENPFVLNFPRPSGDETR